MDPPGSDYVRLTFERAALKEESIGVLLGLSTNKD